MCEADKPDIRAIDVHGVVSHMTFQDRSEAGRFVAAELTSYADRVDVAVIALPRGGVPIGFEIAKTLHAPLDVLPVRKLGMPGNPEFALGAVAPGDVLLLDEDAIRIFGITGEEIDAVVQEERLELQRRERLYRNCREPLVLQNQQVILTDDGLATGWTMRAAILAVRKQQPARIVMAVPVAAPYIIREFQTEADEVVCVSMPESFHAVGQSYRDFRQIPEDLICGFLENAKNLNSRSGRPALEEI